MTVILSILLIQKAVYSWYILISLTLYVHISLNLLSTIYPLENIGKGSSQTNCVHICVTSVVATTYHKGQMISLMSKPQSRSIMWDFTRELDKEPLLN